MLNIREGRYRTSLLVEAYIDNHIDVYDYLVKRQAANVCDYLITKQNYKTRVDVIITSRYVIIQSKDTLQMLICNLIVNSQYNGTRYQHDNVV